MAKNRPLKTLDRVLCYLTTYRDPQRRPTVYDLIVQQGFRIASFDVTPDGRTIIFDRLQEHADVWLMELKD